MTKEDIKARLINNDALFKNIYVFEQQFDIVPEDRKHYGAAVSYQDIMELRSDFLEQLIDTVVDWVYSSEKYAALKAKFIESGKSEGAAVSQVVRKAKAKFRRGDDKLLIQGQLGELLLFHFIQRFKGAVPLLRKMPITTSAEHERYGQKFQEYETEIIDAVNSDRYVGTDMDGFGYLVTYIRQTVLRYGEGSGKRMAETGVMLSPSQIAAIKYKLESLTIPKDICMHNRYWDPVILDAIYKTFDGPVPNSPVERGAQSKLSNILKFLRDTNFTAAMFKRYIPEEYRQGTSRGILCRESIRWASEVPLSEFFKDKFYSDGDIQLKIENKIQMLQKTVSFDIPLLIKPVIEIKNPDSTIVSSLQAGAYKKTTKKMIDIGIPRELAIRLNSMLQESRNSEKMDNYDYEQWVRKSVLKIKPTLSYWEQAQLEFLGD